MTVTFLSILLFFIPFNTCGSCDMLGNFVRAVDDLYGPMQSSVVINDKIDDGFDLGLCTDTNCLGYSDDAINETVGVLQENLSQNEQGWSWIFSGRNNGELLGRLSGRFFAQQGVNSIDKLNFQLSFQLTFQLSFANTVGHPVVLAKLY